VTAPVRTIACRSSSTEKRSTGATRGLCSVRCPQGPHAAATTNGRAHPDRGALHRQGWVARQSCAALRLHVDPDFYESAVRH
jgi:hypothetical protein